MSRFYVTLPSNSSMDYYPNNTAAQFSTKLPHAIELDGDWEVGLTEISCPIEFCNIVRNQCIVSIRNGDDVKTLPVKPGQYESMKALVDEINRMFRAERISADLELRQMALFLGINAKNQHVSFNKGLSVILGFLPGWWYGRGSVTIQNWRKTLSPVQVNSLYVYCDILESIVVGDVKAPLLRIVGVKRNRLGNMHQMLNPTLYVPLQKKHFDTIEISIMTDTGLPVPFLDGKSFVVLEFRRVVHPYFAI